MDYVVSQRVDKKSIGNRLRNKKIGQLITSQPTYIPKHSHLESNQDQPVRSRLFYPLNYESIAVPTGIEPISKD